MTVLETQGLAANGARMEALYDIVEGKNVGTRFSARRGALQ